MKKILLLSFSIIFLFSCGVSQQHFKTVETQLAKRDYEKASKTIIKAKKSEYGDNNKLLYLMNLGWTFHLAGKSKEAQEVFTEADSTIGDLFTKQTSKDIASFAGNDNNLPFEGEDFEKIMLTIVRTLDFAFSGNGEAARVEVRKVEDRMKFLNAEREQKSTYNEDAFAHYLSALIYELDNEENEAYISYKKAYDAYKVYQKKYGVSQIPLVVKEGVKRYMNEYANDADRTKLEEELKDVSSMDVKEYNKQGQFVFVHYNGYAPKKIDKKFKIQKGHQKDLADDIYMAYPEFQTRKHVIAYAEVSISGQKYKTDVVQPIEAIALIDLKEHMKRIWEKAIARRITKYIASQAAGAVTGDKTWAAIGNLASNLSEQADVRSWRLLPAQIGMSTITLAPGKYDVSVSFHSSTGAVIESTSYKIEVEAGKKVFKWFRTVK